jgi:predicted metal-dependent HD superfamily phosphohydrolase
MSPERWQALMHALGLPESTEMFLALSKAYREPHRHYHTQAHIGDCLEKFDQLRDQASNPNAVELALWFHDAIYDPYRADNEQKSADWAARFLRDGNAPGDFVEQVCLLILATRHAVVPADADTAILIDVDLSILGADTSRYDAFEAEIRREYRWVPLFLYRQKRAAILQSFLQRPRIFASDLFHARYESPARGNLRAAIDRLS